VVEEAEMKRLTKLAEMVAQVVEETTPPHQALQTLVVIHP
jgi:hypothetical protein